MAIGISAALRGIESATPYATKFTLSVTFLVQSTIALIVYRIRGGKDFVWPVYREVKISNIANLPLQNKVYEFSWR